MVLAPELGNILACDGSFCRSRLKLAEKQNPEDTWAGKCLIQKCIAFELPCTDCIGFRITYDFFCISYCNM